MKLVELSNFKQDINNKSVLLYTITNQNGLTVQITNYGARIVSLFTPDKNGNIQDIVLGYNCLNDYLNTENIYFGATIGRFGNRISKAKFNLNNVLYELDSNDTLNCLHGGSIGFHNIVWDVVGHDQNSIELNLFSQEKKRGFPGNLKVKLTYSLNNENELSIKYSAESDKMTVINLTHHSYFNLFDSGRSSIHNHLLEIKASNYTPVNKTLIPSGEIANVEGTPFDFTKFTPIGERINNNHKQLKLALGYDHNYVLNGSGLRSVAKVIEQYSGRTMEVITDQPGMQFYSGNKIANNIKGKHGITYGNYNGFCLETQHFPDSPNKPNFPSTVLRPNENYKSTTIYKFATIKTV